MKKAAGILFLSPRNNVLFLKRGKTAAHFPMHWDFPGGHAEKGEASLETALREAAEEIGKVPDGERTFHTRTQTRAVDGKGIGTPPLLGDQPVPSLAPEMPDDLADEVDFTTYLQQVSTEFAPKLDDEHVAWMWAPANNPPEPLHPGCQIGLDRLSMDELGVARAIADGRLISPQKYENMVLFAIRITGTDVAYRNSLDEFVYRNPKIYLNDEFLARCNGLQVVYKQRTGKDGGFHPKGALLTSDEFAERVVGAIFLPYIAGSEVWGIAKIYDEAAASDMEDKQLSTSPSVYFRDISVNRKQQLDNGSTLLIEGKPSLLDHVAICEQGVWDKAGRAEPGVRSEARGDSAMAGETEAVKEEEKKKADAAEPEIENEEEAKADAEAGIELDKTLSHLADAVESMHRRMDALEDGGGEYPEGEEFGDDGEEELLEEEAALGDDGEDEFIEPEPLAADSRRGRRKDSRGRRRKDAELPEEFKEQEGEPQADAKADSAEDSPAALRKRIAELEARIPKTIGDADYFAMTDAQKRADDVYAVLGSHAPRPLPGETPALYERRVVRDLKQHSKTWKGADVGKVFADDVAFDIVRDQVYSEAKALAMSPASVTAGTLRMITKRSGGHEINEFVGDPRSWMDPMAGATRHYVKEIIVPKN